MARIRVLHIVNDLSLHGGAEMTLLRLLESLGEERNTHAVVTLKPLREGNTIGASIIALGIPMEDLGVNGAFSMLGACFRLVGVIRRTRPDIVSAWLYYACLLASITSIFAGHRPKLLWHIRSLPYVVFAKKPARYIVQRILAVLSRGRHIRIITNSEASKTAHQAIGFSQASEKWGVIPNAVNAERFKPDQSLRTKMRAQLGLPDTALVIGAIGRNVPEKGYPDLFDAVRHLNDRLPPAEFGRLHLVIAGRDLSVEDPALIASGLERDHIHILGARDDIPDILNALDIFVLPSRSESFPNVLAEAMATGLPAIATHVGDCRRVLNDDACLATGAPGATLSDRLCALISFTSEQRHERGTLNRSRIVATYTIEKMLTAFRREFTS